jgi:hypothetical protein
MIVSVICVSEKTHLTNISVDQHSWPLYLPIGIIRKDICRKRKIHTWIDDLLIPCHLNWAKDIEEVWHSAVGTVLSQLRHLDITGPGSKWDCADGFQQHGDPPLAAWVGDYPEQVKVAQVLYGSCAMSEFLKVRRWGIQLFDHSITQETSIFTLSC